MSSNSAIEWTDATWNPLAGCSIVSKGCTNCYAMGFANRLLDKPGSHYEGTTKRVKGHAVWTGKVALAPERILHAPLGWKAPRRVFVNSMSDLFHEDVPDEWILKILDIVRRCSYDGGSNVGKIGGASGQHTFMVLTKRPARMAAFMARLRFNGKANDLRGECCLYLSDDSRPPVVMKNLWLGVSAEDQQSLEARVYPLLRTPAAVRFLSLEPLLDAVDLNCLRAPALKNDGAGHIAESCLYTVKDRAPYLPAHDTAKIDWVIVGGESGPDARTMHPEWVRTVREQCAASGSAFFFKQWGEWHPDALAYTDARTGENPPPRMRVGKKKAGSLLDGKEHREFPR